MMENIDEEMLKIAAKRGNCGACRDDFLKNLRGISYTELEKHIQELEQKGLITIQWLGISDFVVMVTEEGADHLS
jgi:biotin operon repressor